MKKSSIERDLRFILELLKELEEQQKLVKICVKDTLNKIRKEKK